MTRKYGIFDMDNNKEDKLYYFGNETSSKRRKLFRISLSTVVSLPFKDLAKMTVLLPLFGFVFSVAWAMWTDLETATKTHCGVSKIDNMDIFYTDKLLNYNTLHCTLIHLLCYCSLKLDMFLIPNT